MSFESYITEFQSNLALGNATEHTHRPALKTLLESLQSGLVATNEPRRIKAGAPDYILTQGNVPLGYVEAKDVGENLSKIERTNQLKRYREALPNLILTDYLSFRWYVDGEFRMEARLAENRNSKLRADSNGTEEVERLLRAFLLQVTPTVGTPKELAERMAAIAREIRGQIVRTFEQEGDRGQLHIQLEAFQKVLIPDLQPEQFADMYAQTIAYGLFAARTTTDSPETFNRKLAGWDLPRTNPFLRNLFNEIAGPALDDRVAWLVDDLTELLRRANISAILENFGRRTRQEDPVVHFYETFLAAYDPKMRELRGVYYTPEPVVSYIVRSVDQLLKEKFGRSLGLADPNTIILDPATGTATFLYRVIRHIHETLRVQGQLGAWSEYVRNNLLPRIFGFELLMASYTVAHMKLGIVLKELGYNFESDERLRVYLTNTLEKGTHSRETIGFAQYISQEADAATEVKEEAPIEVIVGNPPWANYGQMNRNPWISELLQDYKKGLEEKKLNLDDDFIKFVRFSQWRINRTGRGVMALVTSSTYIDGITHRRMRESLMETFTDIYVLDLHGSSRKRDQVPDGSKDENVFDIQQGVAISLFVKEPNKTGPAKVHHADLWGRRESKYTTLSETDTATTKWSELTDVRRQSCLGSFYFFTPKAFDNIDEYCTGWSVKDIFITSGLGMKTERDKATIHWTRAAIESTVEDFRTLDEETIREKYSLGSDSRDWKVAGAKSDVLSNTGEELFQRVLYRPFDVRHTWYSGKTRGFIGTPGYRTMRHMAVGDNLGLSASRTVYGATPWRDVLATKYMAEFGVMATRPGNSAPVFPLYLEDNILDSEARSPNLTQEFIRALSEKLGLKFVPHGNCSLEDAFGPRDIFNYAYAVFFSPTYRERYAEFLKIDFPRLPLTSNREQFSALSKQGAELVALHLMESPALNQLVTSFSESGDNEVQYVRYVEPQEDQQGRLYINGEQYFDGLEPEVWEFHIGGYQVLHKWLKDRRGRILSFEDIMHYQRIVVALSETRRIMHEIDDLIPEWPIR